MTDTLSTVMKPKSIAVIGASRDVDSPGHKLVENLLRGGFNGPIHPVNPHADHISSIKAHACIADIAGDVDLAVIATPTDAVVDVARECVDKGVKGLVVITGGFTESGEKGADRQRQLVEMVRAAGIRMIGPNCLGIVNTDPAVSMVATFANQLPPAGEIALLAQSGAVAIDVMDKCVELGIGLSECVSVGNKADVSGNDLLVHWARDPRTAVIMLYLESFGNPRKFAQLCKTIAPTKPIVAVKSGRTAIGGKAASSHTAALMSDDLDVDALFEQAGVVRVDTIDEMLDVAHFFAVEELPKGRRVVIIGNSGGPGIMAADACENAGLVVGHLSSDTESALRKALGDAASVHNPIDMTASATAQQYESALNIVMQDDGIDAAIVIYTSLPPSHARLVAEAISRVRFFATKPIVANFIAADGEIQEILEQAHIVNYDTVEDAAFVVSRAVQLNEWRNTPEESAPELPAVDTVHAKALIRDTVLSESDGWLDTTLTIELLLSYGIQMIETRHAGSAEEAVKAADDLGFPVALKTAAVPGAHKTDIGGVKLQLRSGEEVEQAYGDIQHYLGEDFTHVTVQPMAKSGIELIVGAVQDPLFGPVVVFGLGGITTEVLGDRAVRLAPLTRRDARQLIRSIKGAPLLFGYRNLQPVDENALIDLLCRVSALMHDNPEITELDLNPVIASSNGTVIVDARIRVATQGAH